MRRTAVFLGIAAGVFLGVFPAFTWPAFAWGPQGHQIIAHIAARHLAPAARAKVGALLGGNAEAMMVLYSTWADEIRADHPETSDWHFVNIELGSRGYEVSRDCPDGACVVAQIARNEKILADPKAPARGEALRFLIHFVGDIHQPLHTFDNRDRGGNLVDVVMGAQRTSLHHVWDTDVVAVFGEDTARAAGAIEASLSPAQKDAWSKGVPADWANESFHVAEQIYARLPRGGPVPLPPDYAARQREIVRVQLAKAGLRLAALLNAALK